MRSEPKEFEGFYRLGQIVRTHGVKGNVVLLLDVDIPDRYKKLKTVHLEMNGLLHSKDISRISISGKNAIIGFTEITDMDEAAKLIRSDVFLPLSELPEPSGNKVYFHEAIGMKVIDLKEGELGNITAIIDLPEQPVAVVDFNGSELLFPFLTHFFENVNRKEKVLRVSLPEGLVDIYRPKKSDEPTG